MAVHSHLERSRGRKLANYGTEGEGQGTLRLQLENVDTGWLPEAVPQHIRRLRKTESPWPSPRALLSCRPGLGLGSPLPAPPCALFRKTETFPFSPASCFSNFMIV